MVFRSAFEALVRFAVIEQVADAVHRVLEDRGGGENDQADLRVHKWNDVESGNKSGEFPDKAEVFECFHGDLSVVSTTAKFFHHRHQRHDSYRQAHAE